MPQIRALEILKQLCLSSIVKHIDSWCLDYVDNYLDKENQYIHLLGPFHETPSCIIELIIKELNLKGYIRSHHLHVLIVEHLQKFFLQRRTADINGTLRLLAKRCKELKCLCLANYDKISRNVLNAAISQLTQLEVIKLSYCNVFDQTVSVISTHCRMVRELDLMGTRVTDCGVFSLYQNIEDDFLNSSTPRKTITSSLESLDVRDTFVTSESVKGALLNLPNLSVLTSEILLISLAEILNMFDAKGAESGHPVFQLKNICHKVLFPHKGLTTQNLKRVLQMCPKAHDIVCYGNASAPNFFLQFADLNFITELTLDSPLDGRVSFATQILPILRATGSNISTLSLGKFSLVDIPAIGTHCPHLESLLFYENTFSQSRDSSYGEFSFSYLTKLEVHSMCAETPLLANEDFCVTRVDLAALLASSFLVSLYLTDQKYVDDKLLKDVFKTNSFPCLKILSLEDCDFVTKKSVWKFLQFRNPLTTLVLRDCSLITRKDYEAFQVYVMNKRYDLKIVYV